MALWRTRRGIPLAVVAEDLAGALAGDVEVAVRVEHSLPRLAQAAAAGADERAQGGAAHVVLEYFVGTLVGDVEVVAGRIKRQAGGRGQAARDHAEQVPGR